MMPQRYDKYKIKAILLFSIIICLFAMRFIGSFIVEEALKRKFGVWAGIRPTSSKRYLKNRKIHFLELDFAHPNELRVQFSIITSLVLHEY